ncbi:site-specific recombinase : Site-specific recombinase XerD OS=Singulisphaera acidiphila (strain ATCC BAA-1392 / DSM 18658 / VKM B-2454 / MOB10) GN=Sinac_1949 PE=4 SV=1: Phage_integrase [Gemmata massiliana]|uniref:Tyr recombinase domain-containing protein n=1 Tax=Gemmata massiliana TaxID=1210884 RepID=A0A6P2D0C1_9BACT|nr:site-specific integrase [Gemmata massiliana]VTR92872.1 site-specific recombinase : Site-specific recombinase XerD OS=Singulisphaera acidiphila (strain ATCC BAA-1392 / DSM 18658 / VKM B-2454 / MOB10) GN=Sinac_1949 PE=4 SV=1: Phage_integrase [Gemmata massiliana]
MAWLETKGNVFRIRFRYGGTKHLLTLHTSDKKEADESLACFGANLRLIERGIIDPPPAAAEIGRYIISGGKLARRPSETARSERATLGILFDRYLTSFPRAAKEASTWKTETIHIGHLRRLLDVRLPLADVSQKTIQEYIDARTQETGLRKKRISRETVRKELGTFSAIWNKWGVPQGLVSGPPPVTNLTFPKGSAKAPFQTREQIERQIARHKLSLNAQAELWHGLFLTLPEVEELLDHVRAAGRPAYVYPMMMFAAHTGARRSEIRRSLVNDFDFVGKTVMIREKKKDHDKIETYRTVPLSPRLETAMREWFQKHGGGMHTICTPSGRAITDHYATKIMLGAVRRSKWSVISGWHCLRHSFISNCAARGVDQRLIDHWVGHTTEAMRRRYSHLLPAVSQAALFSVFGIRS